ncbi:MAG: glycosyltransferase family 2 protein [Motilibacteraceae bacterium]
MPGPLLQRAALLGHEPARVRRPVEHRGRPRVSVVVPCYNYGAYLPACVESVLRQPRVDVDVVVVDDASTDGSGEVARALALADERVRVVRHRQNLGHIRTYNDGLALVQGTYVVLLSADDLLTDGALARATDLMEAEPSVGMVYGSSVTFSAALPPAARLRARSWTVWSGRSWVAERCRTARSSISSPEVVMRTSVLRAVGGYREDLPHSGDFEMWLRAAAASDVGLLGGVDQAYYRLHGANMSRTTYASVLVNLQARRDALEVFFAGRGGALAGAEQLRLTAMRALARETLRYALAAVDGRGPAEVAEGEDVGAYLRLARQVLPDVEGLPEWQALGRRGVVGAPGGGWSRPAGELRERGERLVQAATTRLAWHRWRWSGV